jgi:hypothetical protein
VASNVPNEDAWDSSGIEGLVPLPRNYNRIRAGDYDVSGWLTHNFMAAVWTQITRQFLQSDVATTFLLYPHEEKGWNDAFNTPLKTLDKRAIVVLLFGDVHYIVFEANFGERRIKCYDGLLSSDADRKEKERLMNLFGRCIDQQRDILDPTQMRRGPWKTEFSCFLRQTDRSSCGPIAILAFVKLYTGMSLFQEMDETRSYQPYDKVIRAGLLRVCCSMLDQNVSSRVADRACAETAAHYAEFYGGEENVPKVLIPPLELPLRLSSFLSGPSTEDLSAERKVLASNISEPHCAIRKQSKHKNDEGKVKGSGTRVTAMLPQRTPLKQMRTKVSVRNASISAVPFTCAIEQGSENKNPNTGTVNLSVSHGDEIISSSPCENDRRPHQVQGAAKRPLGMQGGPTSATNDSGLSSPQSLAREDGRNSCDKNGSLDAASLGSKSVPDLLEEPSEESQPDNQADPQISNSSSADAELLVTFQPPLTEAELQQIKEWWLEVEPRLDEPDYVVDISRVPPRLEVIFPELQM